MRLARDYTEARGRFLDAAHASNARVEHHVHPLTGPAGEPLATDVAIHRRPDAPTRLLVISGTHGVEGFAGSLCQTTLLAQDAVVPDDLAIVLVHAINPYGFAWIRRVNEDNVDLNRNCIDFAAGVPENPGYDQLAAALGAADLGRGRRSRRPRRAARVRDRARVRRTAGRGLEGQYRHPTGIFYGGRGRCGRSARSRRSPASTLTGRRSAPRSSTCTPGSARSGR